MLARLAVAVLFVAMVLSAVYAVSDSRRSTMVSLWLAIPTVIVDACYVGLPWLGMEVAAWLLNIVFLGYAVVVLLKHLFTTRRVTLNTIAASLCVYLLLAVLWAVLYSAVEALVPGSFAYNLADGDPTDSIHFGDSRSLFAVYFSLVTMTTLGYGDVVPRTAPAQALATTQAVVGQLYLTVLVARLVGLHIVVAAEKSGRQ